MALLTLKVKDGQKVRLTIGKYMPASSNVTANTLISSDVDNQLVTGTDGRLFVANPFNAFRFTISLAEADIDFSKA